MIGQSRVSRASELKTLAGGKTHERDDSSPKFFLLPGGTTRSHLFQDRRTLAPRPEGIPDRGGEARRARERREERRLVCSRVTRPGGAERRRQVRIRN